MLAGLAYWQRNVAVKQERLTEEQRVAALAELATSERLRGNWNTALKLSVHAVRLALGLHKDRTGYRRRGLRPLPQFGKPTGG